MSPLFLLLANIGITLGESFIKNPQLQQTVADSVTAVQDFIRTLTNKSGSVAGPVFLTALQAAFLVLKDTGKITADEYTALNDAVTKTLAADVQGQQLIDPTTIDAAHAIQSLP